MKEALKLALEALEFIPESGSMLGFYAEAKRHKAIIVIKEALAQPEEQQSCDKQEPIVGLQCVNCQITIESLNDKVMWLMERPWVGLTDEEIKAMDASTTSNSSFYAGAFWAEAKLKEKNTCQE